MIQNLGQIHEGLVGNRSVLVEAFFFVKICSPFLLSRKSREVLKSFLLKKGNNAALVEPKTETKVYQLLSETVLS